MMSWPIAKAAVRKYTKATTLEQIYLEDNEYAYFGTGKDGYVYFDGTNLIMKTDAGMIQLNAAGTYIEFNKPTRYTGTNPRKDYGGDTTGDDYDIYANSVDAKPNMTFYGNLSIQLNTAYHILEALAVNTSGRWWAVINSDSAFCFRVEGNKAVNCYGTLDVAGTTTLAALTQVGACSLGDVTLNGLLMASPAEAANVNGDTTPTVAGINSMLITNTGATSITDFSDGIEGQILILRFADANTTIVDNAGGAATGPIYLSGQANKNFAANQTLVLIARGGVVPVLWFQIGGEI